MDIEKIVEHQFNMIAKNPNLTRSPQITYELHHNIKVLCQEYLGNEYEVICQDTRELNYDGEFTSKKMDIAIKHNNKVVGNIETKTIRSSYKKNSINYFYNMIGETMNIQDSGVKVCQLLILPEKVPCVLGKEIIYETIEDAQLEKYHKLLQYNHAGVPDKMIIKIVKMNYNTHICEQTDYTTFTNPNIKEMLIQMSNVEENIKSFLDSIVEGELNEQN